MTIKSFGLSDIGLNRPNNEDVWTAIPEIGFFALADGMGGHKAGEVAAHEAIETLTNSIRKNKREDPLEIIIELRTAIEKANQWVYRLGKNIEELNGMGTTLCCLIYSEKAIVYAHIGDSRVYRLRDKRLELLTEDHSLFAKWQKTGKTSKTPFPYKNVITRAIGMTPIANPEIAISAHIPGDLFFLCTDGLTDVLSLKDIEKIINNSNDLETATKQLIHAAKNKRSSDNITILMIQIDGQSEENLSRQQCNDSPRQESFRRDASRTEGDTRKSI